MKTAPRPKQPVCNCRLRTFPHREDQYCRELREYAAEEYAEMRRDDERERAKYVNAINRGAAK